jgi:ergothioneine biosynthesis protein EgtC
MCRFVAYLGPPVTIGSLVTEPSHSLIHQSYRSAERKEPLNGDGFGLAWYVPELSELPAVYRSISPAWSNRNLRNLARVTRSACIFAHVRAASPGMPVVETNCHPFSNGKYSFMHNGRVGGFHLLRRQILNRLSDHVFQSIIGSTDSEHVFALFREHVEREGDGDPLATIVRALQAAIRDVFLLVKKNEPPEDFCTLNLAVADGKRAVISRCSSRVNDGHAETLYYHIGKRYVCKDGDSRLVDVEYGRGAVLVSSEALSPDPGWKPVPINHMLVVDADQQVTVVDCELP